LTPRRLLVVLDCCHAAGMAVKGADAGPAPFAGAALPPALFLPTGKSPGAGPGSGEGRAVLSSCKPAEYSYLRADGRMSLFSFHLIEALTGHAQPSGGAAEVLVSDLISYLQRHVPQSALAQHGAAQTPDPRLTGNFLVALVLGGDGLAKGQAAPDPLAPLPPAASWQASVSGSGAVAQEGGNALGERAVQIGGDNSGTIVSGTQIVKHYYQAAGGSEAHVALNEVLGLGNRLAIIGGPGCGKTTVLLHMAWALATSLLAGEPEPAHSRLGLTVAPSELPLPILVPLASFARYRRQLPAGAPAHEKTLATFISHHLISSEAPFDLPVDFFVRLLKDGRNVLLLLDGLDEVANEGERAEVRQSVQNLVASRNAMRVVVTCRTIAYRSGGTALGGDFREIAVQAAGPRTAHRADGASGLRLHPPAGQRAPQRACR